VGLPPERLGKGHGPRLEVAPGHGKRAPHIATARVRGELKPPSSASRRTSGRCRRRRDVVVFGEQLDQVTADETGATMTKMRLFRSFTPLSSVSG